MKHPSESDLALFAGTTPAGGDLGIVERWRINAHVRACSDCRGEVESYRKASEAIRESAAALPEGLNWNRLAQEMTGNIRVGLAAGECVGPVPSHARGLAWNTAAALAAALVIVLGALWLNIPREQSERLLTAFHAVRHQRAGLHEAVLQDNVVLEASPASIDLKSSAGTMSLLNSNPNAAAVSVSMQGSAGAEYVDGDTGQVTINKVYYAQ